MANVTITSSNVVPPTANSTRRYPASNTNIAGEAIAAGEIVCLVEADGKFYKAIASDSDKRDVKGFAGNTAAAAGQRVDVIQESPALVVGAHGVTLGTPLFLSATAGKICPLEDLVAGDLAVQVATADTATTFKVAINAASTAIAA